MTYKPQPGDAQRFLDSFLGKEAVSMTDDETGRALQRRVDEAGQAYSDAMVALLQHLVGLAKVDMDKVSMTGDSLWGIGAPVDEHARIWGLGDVKEEGAAKPWGRNADLIAGDGHVYLIDRDVLFPSSQSYVGGPLVVGCRDAYRSAPTPKADGVYPDHTEAEYADWVRRQWPATVATAAATLPPSDPKPDPNAPTKPANEGLFRAIGGKK